MKTHPATTRRPLSPGGRRRRLLVALLTALSLSIPTLTACGIAQTGERVATDAIDLIEQSIRELEAQSANWQQVLEKTRDKLTADAQSTARNELTNLITRTTAAVGEQFKCATDFLGERAKQGLRDIKASLLGTPALVTPVLCDVTPSSVDMSLTPDRRTTIEVSGFNFDAPGLELFLRRGNEEVRVDPRLVSIQHHYHLNINLGANGVILDGSSQSLTLRWNGTDLSTVPVVQPLPPACQLTTIEHAVDPVTYMPPWDPSTGDREFFGNVDITIKLTLLPASDYIDARLYMSAVQSGDDHTTAAGETTFRFYTAPAGQRIKQAVGPLEAELSYHDTTWEDDIFGGGGGIVAEYRVRGDHSGPDAGTWAQVEMAFNVLKLQLVATQNCV